MTATIRRIQRTQVAAAGWRAGSDLEDIVSWRLHRLGWTPAEVQREHPVGRYRVDFAFMAARVALEVDGWHHRSPEGAEKDARKDCALRAAGWLVLRIDDLDGVEGMLDQLVRVVRVVRQVETGGGP